MNDEPTVSAPGEESDVSPSDTLTITMMTVAGLFMAMLIGFSILSVALRYLFHRPIVGADQVIGILVAFTTFAGCAVANRNKLHITLDLVDEYLPKSFARFKSALTLASTFLVFCLLAKVMFDQALYLSRGGYYYDFAPIPMSWVVFALTGICAVGAMVILKPFLALLLRR